jgi:hypothetical protein
VVDVLVPVLVALAGAAVHGITGVRQQGAAHRVGGGPAVTRLLFAGVTGFAVHRRRVDWPFLGALLLTAVGLAAFLVVARPTTGGGEPTPGRILPLGIGLAVVAAGCVVWSLRTRGLSRSHAVAARGGGHRCGISGEVLALAAMAGGVWLVAHRTPRVAGGHGGRGTGGTPEEGRHAETAAAAPA